MKLLSVLGAMALIAAPATAIAQSKLPEFSAVNMLAGGVQINGAASKDSSGCSDSPRLFCSDIEPGFLSTECITTNINGQDIYVDQYHFVVNSTRRVIVNYTAQFSTDNFGSDQLDPILVIVRDTNGDNLSGGEPIVASNDDSGWPNSTARNSAIDQVYDPGTYVIRTETFGQFDTGPYGINITCPNANNRNVSNYHTGVWETVNQNGSGFPVTILPNGGAVGYWFIYRNNTNGTSFWTVMPGTTSGNTINFDVIDLEGPGFGPDYVENALDVRTLGVGRMQIFGCTQGLFEFFSNVPASFPSYAMTVNKFTNTPGLNCP